MIISSSIQCPFLFSFRCYVHHLLSHHANQFYFPWLACYFVSGSHSDKISLLFKKKTLFVIYHRHLKLGNWQPHVNLLHVTDQYFLLDCITCILFLIILQLGPYLRFWIGSMYSFYTFVKSYYWKQIFYVMSILCTFNM